jgi:hypothetical protein
LVTANSEGSVLLPADDEPPLAWVGHRHLL